MKKNFSIHQFATFVTNVILFFQCMAMALYLQIYVSQGFLSPWPALFFMWSGLGFIIGAVYHGLLNNGKIFWGTCFSFLIMAFGGASSYSLGMLAGRFLFNGPNIIWNILWALLLASYLIYCLYAFFKHGDLSYAYVFFLAIPGSLILIYLLPYLYFQTGEGSTLLILFGILTLIFASIQQKMHLAIDPIRFDHNALYHVICMVGFAFMFWGFIGLNS